jgi:hypothetical protein
MIDITLEQAIPLRLVPGGLIPGRHGQKIHTSTLFRWASVGIKGVVLETVPIGGTRCTSIEALQRFFNRLEQARQPGGLPGSDSVPLSSARTETQRTQSHKVAIDKLDRTLYPRKRSSSPRPGRSRPTRTAGR